MPFDGWYTLFTWRIIVSAISIIQLLLFYSEVFVLIVSFDSLLVNPVYGSLSEFLESLLERFAGRYYSDKPRWTVKLLLVVIF